MTHYQMQLIVPIDTSNIHKANKEIEHLEQCFKDIIGSFTSYSDQFYRVYSLICNEEQSDKLAIKIRGRCALLEVVPVTTIPPLTTITPISSVI
ncbi:hypothetical protein [Dictyobacter aurantiacus]|uniref:Transcription regulator AsnC/Lrp ligand binding domain-containing protein n=1 Tax=Dictyobacter aurantiacus TaxID=1936993 RepID=A0A401ZQ38_9CHLR|nr:hypothetical protein [Dictyobacter aurantiacus]GCE08987.1 hypothetical protein KDAU_63160 [Dictyobacter aurantiacus]